MFIEMKVEITKEQYDAVKGDSLAIMKLASQTAIDVGYHPAGYDCIDPALDTNSGRYYIIWYRQRCCD